jgi:hypothetical protein
MFDGKLTKAEEKEIFFRTLFELFSTLFIPPPLLPKALGFFRLIRSLHINPSEFAFFLKIILLLSQFFVPT